MIFYKRNLELMIYHLGILNKYEVVELFNNAEGVIFKIYCDRDYLFTLIPVLAGNLSFKTIAGNQVGEHLIDWELYSKVESAMYSIFVTAPDS